MRLIDGQLNLMTYWYYWTVIYAVIKLTMNCQMVRLRLQWWNLTSSRSPRGLIYRPQTKAWIIQSRSQTHWWCPSKPDPSDLLRSSRWCPAITRLEACSRSTFHHLDSSDLPWHGDTGDRCCGAGRRQIVLATNRNGGMLRLNATRHDDDNDVDEIDWYFTYYCMNGLLLTTAVHTNADNCCNIKMVENRQTIHKSKWNSLKIEKCATQQH